MAHEVQLPQLVKKLQMKTIDKGIFYCLQPYVVRALALAVCFALKGAAVCIEY